jgi:hypothetical protein
MYITRVRYCFWFSPAIVGLLGAAAEGQTYTPTYSLLVAERNGIPLNPPQAAVNVSPGDVLVVEIYLRCWSNGQRSDDPTVTPLLRGYQATFDCNGFYSGAGGNVLPVDFAVASPNPANAFIDTSRSDFVLTCPLRAVTTNSLACDYAYAGANFTNCPGELGLCPPEELKYSGTIRLHVSTDAAGTFTVCLDDRENLPNFPAPGPDRSYLTPTSPSVGVRILPLDFECATVIVAGGDPLGACCRSSLPCANGFTQGGCESLGGIFQGNGSMCGPNSCSQPSSNGACCSGVSGTQCAGGVTESHCATIGGIYQGDGTVCGPGVCPPEGPEGACCIADVCGGVVTRFECVSLGGSYQGDGTACGPTTCIAQATQGACCTPDGACVVLSSQSACLALGGIYQGDGSSCEDFACRIPTISHWGALVLAMLLLTAGKVYFRRGIHAGN